jgi:hypothetical protein
VLAAVMASNRNNKVISMFFFINFIILFELNFIWNFQLLI